MTEIMCIEIVVDNITTRFKLEKPVEVMKDTTGNYGVKLNSEGYTPVTQVVAFESIKAALEWLNQLQKAS